MSIITDNYMLFIIIGLVFLFITIGYYADKTGFGKNKLSDSDKNIDPVDPDTVDMQSLIDDKKSLSQQSLQALVQQPLPINDLPQNISDSVQESEDLPILDLDNDDNSVSNSNNFNTTNESSTAPKVTVDNTDADIWKF